MIQVNRRSLAVSHAGFIRPCKNKTYMCGQEGWGAIHYEEREEGKRTRGGRGGVRGEGPR